MQKCKDCISWFGNKNWQVCQTYKKSGDIDYYNRTDRMLMASSPNTENNCKKFTTKEVTK